LISWEEGVNNGAAITEYRLEWSRKENDSFMQLYCGLNSTYEAKGLTPVTHYFFRVQVREMNSILSNNKKTTTSSHFRRLSIQQVQVCTVC